MRFTKVMIVVVALVSVGLNFFLYRKTLSQRAHVRVNDKVYTKKLFYDWLERSYGTQMTARIVSYELIMQAADKAGVKPDEKEVQEQLATLRDSQPQTFGVRFRYQPWTVRDAQEDIETKLALLGLQCKEVKASDDDLRQFFAAHPGAFDKPDKIYLKAVICSNQTAADDARQFMEKVSDMMLVKQQLRDKVKLVGGDGTWLVLRPYGKAIQDPNLAAVAALPAGQTRMVKSGNGEWLVLKHERTEPGKKVTFEEVKDKVERSYKVTRARPQAEILRNIWDQSKIETEQPELKDQIENALFPDRITQPKQ